MLSMMNSPPKTPKNTEEIVSSGPPNRRLRKTSWLSMGDALRCSPYDEDQAQHHTRNQQGQRQA